GLTTLEAAADVALTRAHEGDGAEPGSASEADDGSRDAAGTAPVVIDLATVESAVDRAAVRYDRDGDQHYDVISAFIKSIRGSDPDADGLDERADHVVVLVPVAVVADGG